MYIVNNNRCQIIDCFEKNHHNLFLFSRHWDATASSGFLYPIERENYLEL